MTTKKNRNLLLRSALLLLPAGLGFTTQAFAVKVSDALDVGGALRTRLDYDPKRKISEFGFDTLMLSAKYDADGWLAAGRYRFYGKAYPFRYVRAGGVSFAEYAWVGYRFDENHQLQVGLNQVPFGLMPYFSSSFYETLGNVIGLEDVTQVGAKYIQQSGDWNLQLGYYTRPAWPGHGTSRGSTYSIVVTPADGYVTGGSHNEEREVAVARLVRAFNHGPWAGEVGASLRVSSLRNRNTGRTGARNVYALHYVLQKGGWGAKLQFARQQMSPQNPGDRQTVTFGGFDGTFNVASRGNLYLGDLSYQIPGTFAGGWVSGIKPFVTYSRFSKSAPHFKDSQRLFVGTSFSLKKLWISMEWQHGRNDPYIGGSSYTQSLAARGTDRWRSQFYANIGYYF